MLCGKMNITHVLREKTQKGDRRVEIQNGKNKRTILVTNDDGIMADGLLRLVRAAQQFGEVWVVAPDGERSAASHSISLHSPIDVRPCAFGVEGVRAFSCSGTPADCVRVGSLSVMPYQPEMVLSGINFGYNTATDLQYSATVGAALEAAFQGYFGIALSEGRGGHEVTDRYLEEILSEIMEMEPMEGKILNINFPDCPAAQCRGIIRNLKVSKSMLFRDRYAVLEELPHGGKRYMVDGQYQEVAEEGTDLKAVLDRYVSIGWVNNLH